MKKIICLLFCVLLFSFPGCSSGKIFDKMPDNNSLPIKEMSIGIFGSINFSDAGYANENHFYLTRRSLNGYSVDKKGYYVYDSVENFSEVTENAKGIVVYYGLAYAVTEENGREYLTVISDHAANYLRKYDINEFKESAVNFHRNYGNTVSGGDGLLPYGNLSSSA